VDFAVQNARAMGLKKILPRISGYSVPDVLNQKSAVQDTWFSNNQIICLKLTN